MKQPLKVIKLDNAKLTILKEDVIKPRNGKLLGVPRFSYVYESDSGEFYIEKTSLLPLAYLIDDFDEVKQEVLELITPIKNAR